VGGAQRRPAFDELLRLARPHRFDPVLVGRPLAGRRDAALVCSAGLARRQIRALHSEVDGDGQLVVPTLPAMPNTPAGNVRGVRGHPRWL
jgi:hypothetical protein